jgi:zinc transport system substrate-binding protein
VTVRHRLRVVAFAVGFVLTLSACDAGTATTQDGSISVVTSFYPLAFAAERIGGDAVTVTNLTPPGVEPHDLELTPEDLEAIGTADVVVYLGGGFQPAVEEAVAAESTGATIDVAEGEDLLASSEAAHEEGSALDPHLWLDPGLFGEVVAGMADAMAAQDPSQAERFAAAAADLDEELSALDARFRTELADCSTRVMVTNHAAFGYLAAAYGLRQESISGISPEAEPDPRRLAELADLVAEEGVTTVFTEELVSPAVAETLAEEAGVATATLNPLEGLTDEQIAAGEDYLSVMRANLETLRDGLGCS